MSFAVFITSLWIIIFLDSTYKREKRFDKRRDSHSQNTQYAASGKEIVICGTYLSHVDLNTVKVKKKCLQKIALNQYLSDAGLCKIICMDNARYRCKETQTYFTQQHHSSACYELWDDHAIDICSLKDCGQWTISNLHVIQVYMEQKLMKIIDLFPYFVSAKDIGFQFANCKLSLGIVVHGGLLTKYIYRCSPNRNVCELMVFPTVSCQSFPLPNQVIELLYWVIEQYFSTLKPIQNDHYIADGSYKSVVCMKKSKCH